MFQEIYLNFLFINILKPCEASEGEWLHKKTRIKFFNAYVPKTTFPSCKKSKSAIHR